MAHADFNSTQFAKFEADPRQAVKVNEWGGRVRVAFFSFTAPEQIEIGDTVGLVRLPRGARVLGGVVMVDTNTASLTGSVGTADDADKYGSAIDMDTAAAPSDFANTIARNYGAETTEDEDVILTTAGAAFLSGDIISGHMLYALD